MKLLTKEEEAAHYRATLVGGSVSGVAGLAVGVAGVALASRRYHFIKNLTLPLKAFLVTSSGTFAGIIGADHASRSYESERNPIDVEYRQREERQSQADKANKSFTQRAMDFGKQERYKIVGASWIASMAAAFALVNRNKYLSGPQKLVQARVYAQFLTLGVLVASAAFEISDSKNQAGHWETVKYVDPNDPDHKRMLERKEYKEGESPQQSGGDDLWKDMVAAEEERLKERDQEEAKLKKGKSKKNGDGKDKKNDDDDGDDKKKDKKGDDKEKDKQSEDKEKDKKSEDKEKDKKSEDKEKEKKNDDKEKDKKSDENEKDTKTDDKKKDTKDEKSDEKKRDSEKDEKKDSSKDEKKDPSKDEKKNSSKDEKKDSSKDEKKTEKKSSDTDDAKDKEKEKDKDKEQEKEKESPKSKSKK